MAQKKRKRRNREHPLLARFVTLLVMIFWGFCGFTIVSKQNSILETQQEIAAVEENIAEAELEQEELIDILKSDDMGDYIEKLALEEYGYAYPDERRYYDTSRD